MRGVLAHAELRRHAAHRGLRPQSVVAVSLHRRRGEDLQRAPRRRPDTPPNLAGLPGRRVTARAKPMTDSALEAVGETDDPTGRDQLRQRPTRHPQTRTDAQHRQPSPPIRRLVLAGELVGQRPTDPQHGGRFVDRQQHRVLIERTQHHLDDAHMPTYSHVVRRRNPLPPGRLDVVVATADNQRQRRTTTDNPGQFSTIAALRKVKRAHHLGGSAKRHMASVSLHRRSSRPL